MGINGSGIDIRPIGSLNISYERQPQSTTSPFETVDLEFTVDDDSTVSLSIGTGALTVTQKVPGQMSFKVVTGIAPNTYDVVVEISGATSVTPAPSTGSYDPTLSFVPPYEGEQGSTPGLSTLIVELLGLICTVTVVQ